MNPIDENVEGVDSETSELKSRRENSDNEDDEDLGRSQEDIDLGSVEVTSKASPSRISKPLLS
jgi:hypothetical protein